MRKFKQTFINLTALILIFQSSSLFSQEASVSDLFNAIKSEVDASQMESILLKMEVASKTDKNPSNSILIDAARSYTAAALAQLGKVDQANQYVDKIAALEMKESAVITIARDLTEKGKYKLASHYINNYLTGEKKMQLPESSRARTEISFIYGITLYHMGKYEESLSYLGGQKKRRRGKDCEYYPLALIALGQDAKAYQVVKELMLSGVRISPDFTQAARRLFIKVNGNSLRYDGLVDSLYQVENKKIEDKVMKMAVNIPAPDFELTDLNGKKVSLASLKGKTVIIDFWATWCIPCVGSFPAMQKAVDYYKNDKSVIFLFVHSYDKGPNASQDALKIIKSKNYTFDVFMDLKNKTTGKSPVAGLFNVTNLPTKLVIDPKGFIRFRNSGFLEVDEAIAEISTMVEKSRT